MRKKYYLYAGYYELWISDRILRRPFILLSTHFSFDAAYDAAERYDTDACKCYDTSIRKDAEAHFEYAGSDAIRQMPFFDGSAYSIERGLTDYTLENARICPDYQPTPQCLTDYINLLHVKGGLPLRRSRRLCAQKTYRQLGDLVSRYVHT